MHKSEGRLDLQGKVVGILSAGFHPNDFLIGGTVRTIAGPVLSVVISSLRIVQNVSQPSNPHSGP